MDMGFAIAFPGAELPPESISAYVSDWSSMIKSNGPERFLTGLRHACEITSFFPTLADVAGDIPQPIPSSYSGWSEDDRARRAAGERSYGKCDV
jgi:hypothetical protein